MLNSFIFLLYVCDMTVEGLQCMTRNKNGGKAYTFRKFLLYNNIIHVIRLCSVVEVLGSNPPGAESYKKLSKCTLK